MKHSLIPILFALTFFSNPISFAQSNDLVSKSLCSCSDVMNGHCVLQNVTPSFEDIIALHRQERMQPNASAIKEIPLTFLNKPEGRDLYNSPGEINTLYLNKPATLFIGREESPSSETDMQIAIYKKIDEGTYLHLNGLPGVPHLGLQDPFSSEIYTEYGKELILGGVKVWPDHDESGKEVLRYATVFFRDYGKGIERLTQFLVGPDKMKDVRLAQSPDHKTITVFTRPQSGNPETGGRGKIGIFHVNRLEEITQAKITEAPVFKNQFHHYSWGGVNAAVYLDDTRIGVVGHYARFDENGIRDYIAVSWIVDTKTNSITDVKVIAERKDLPNGIDRGAKRDDLKNVMFPGGFRRNTDGTMDIWGGEGDQGTFQIRVTDPFQK